MNAAAAVGAAGSGRAGAGTETAETITGSALTHERATAASLGLLRMWVFGIWLVEVALDPIGDLARLPAAAFDPPTPIGLLPQRWLGWLLDPALLTALRLVLAVGLVVVVAGAYRRAWVPVTVVAGLVVHQALVRSFGSAGHMELTLLYASALLCLFPLTDGLAWRPARRWRRSPPRPRPPVPRAQPVYAAPFVLVALVVALTYLATGAARLWKGLDLFTTSTLRDLVALHAVHGDGFFGLGRGMPAAVVRTVPAAVWQGVYVGITLVELAFPLVLVSRVARRVLVPTMIAFHLASWPLLGLRFFENVLLMVVLSTVTFHRVAVALERRRQEGLRREGLRREEPRRPGLPAKGSGGSEGGDLGFVVAEDLVEDLGRVLPGGGRLGRRR